MVSSSALPAHGRVSNFPDGLFRFMRQHGINISNRPGNYPFYDTRFEAPVVVQYTSIGTECSFGAYSGVFGSSRGLFGRCSIGRFCSIADGFVIGPDEHPHQFFTTSMVGYVKNVHGWDDLRASWGHNRETPYVRFDQRSKVLVGNDVWIGADVFIRRGVEIGDGAIIGAESVVTRDVPAYSIVVGNPAKFVRMRFPEHIVERFLDVHWWKYDIFNIKGFSFDNVELALDALEQAKKDRMLVPLALKAATIRDLWHDWAIQQDT